MNNLLKIIVCVAILLGISVDPTTGSFTVAGAEAQTQTVVMVNCSGLSRSACEIAKEQVGRAPYIGPIRPATEAMACARVVSYGPAHVVWVAGNADTYNRGAPVITQTGIVHTEQFVLNPRWTVTESCIPRRLLNGVAELTLCTGLYEDGYHWSLTAAELGQMKETGHFTSYAPFLTVRDRESLSVAAVAAAYRARYMTRTR